MARSQKRVVAWQVFHIYGAKFEDVLPRPLSVLWSANFRVLLLLLFYCNKNNTFPFVVRVITRTVQDVCRGTEEAVLQSQSGNKKK